MDTTYLAGVATERGIEQTALLAAGEDWAALRALGFSYADIALAFNVSKQRVAAKLGPDGLRARRKKDYLKTIPELQDEIWREAAVDPIWWGKSGRIRVSLIVERLVAANYGNYEATTLAPQFSANRVVVTLYTFFDLPTEEKMIEWVQERFWADETLRQIYSKISAVALLDIPYSSWTRWYYANIGG